MTELVLADLQSVESRLPKLQKEARANPKIQPAVTTLERIKTVLDTGKPLWSDQELQSIYLEQLHDLQLLTAKPILYFIQY